MAFELTIIFAFVIQWEHVIEMTLTIVLIVIVTVIFLSNLKITIFFLCP